MTIMPFRCMPVPSFFFFNDTATPEIYTLSLHDALPIFRWGLDRDMEREWAHRNLARRRLRRVKQSNPDRFGIDRKSTRLNSSHMSISYAVFCLKKKTKNTSKCWPIT